MLLRVAYRFELFAREVRIELQRVLVSTPGHRQVAFEFALEETDFGDRRLIQRLEVVVGADARALAMMRIRKLHATNAKTVSNIMKPAVSAPSALPRSPSTGSNHDEAP